MEPRKSKNRPAQAPRRWLSRIGGGGRVVVPAALRQELGLKPGDAVVFESAEGTVALKPQIEVIRALQEKYGKVWQAPEFSSDSFLAERKSMWGEE
jgi:AbrB family looped-hinge helix DNA binding protein